uniref:Uncharacterized protein n=1 Tax=viral metagenome TaxID=1070528 RepID=A0A6M3MF87_9ZZZZ
MKIIEIEKYMEKIKETRRPFAVFRICRTEDIKKIGFGEDHKFETKSFALNLRKNKLKCARTERKYLQAIHWRARNKGYPRGLKRYRTYNEEKEKQFKESRQHHAYIPEIDIPDRWK